MVALIFFPRPCSSLRPRRSLWLAFLFNPLLYSFLMPYCCSRLPLQAKAEQVAALQQQLEAAAAAARDQEAREQLSAQQAANR